MNTSCYLVLTLAVFGASAAPSFLNCGSSLNFGSLSVAPSATLAAAPATTFVSAPATTFAAAPAAVSIPSTFSAIPSSSLAGVPAAPSCGAALQGPTTYHQTGLIEGSNAMLPGFVPSTSVSKSCHCLKTLVRPQYRTEVFTVPSVDRLTRIVNNPVVEVFHSNAGGHNRQFEIPTCGAQSLASSALSSSALAAPAFATSALAAPAFSAGQVFSAPAEIASQIIGGSCI